MEQLTNNNDSTELNKVNSKCTQNYRESVSSASSCHSDFSDDVQFLSRRASSQDIPCTDNNNVSSSLVEYSKLPLIFSEPITYNRKKCFFYLNNIITFNLILIQVMSTTSIF